MTERLDRLGSAKELAQAAAVIGQDFDERLLAAITDRPEQQRKNELKQLAEAEIVVWRGSKSPTAYTFRHALIQETAYQSLLKAKRRELHRRIAESLEAGVVPELAIASLNGSRSIIRRPASSIGRSSVGTNQAHERHNARRISKQKDNSAKR